MKKTLLRKISTKKRQQIEDEKPIRALLELRAGGKCELCGLPLDWRGLHPHEKTFRSHSGKLSLENSVMACGRCSNKEHKIREVESNPMWTPQGRIID